MALTDIFATMIGSTLKESMADILRVETMEDDQTLVLKDGTLMSMIRLDGALRQLGEAEIAGMVERLRVAMSAYFSQPGHALEINFMRDASAAKTYLERTVNRSRRNARKAGLDLDDVLNERITNLSSRMVAETCLITACTRTSVLSAEESKIDAKKVSERVRVLPAMAEAQAPGKVLDTVHERHAAFVDAIRTAFSQAGQLCSVLDVRQALQETRAGLYPETAPYKEEWSPNLPSWSGLREHGKGIVMAPETPAEMANIDKSNLGTTPFCHQLATRDSMIETSRVVRIGDMLFQGMDMTVAPEVLPDFNTLVADITAKGGNIPWRASLRIEAGGVQAQALKLMYLSLFAWAAPTHNNRIRDALHINIDADGSEDTIVRMRMSFATWAPIGRSEQLRRNAGVVAGAVKRWGNSSVDGISGDPLATVLSTCPGATLASTAPVASPPLRDALALMPLARQASPWEHGSVLLRTKSGKPWPFQPGSSKQTTWITLFVGTPGSGKSVAMNAINFGTAIAPNTAGGDKAVLPRIAITDIGPSSSGLISLIKEALPKERRHEAVFQKLRMDAEHAINVFDTQLGMRQPLALEKNFLVNFLTLVCGDGEHSPSQVMSGLISAAIDRVYENMMDHREPKPYRRDDVPLVDRVLDDLEFDAAGDTIWWEVVDFLVEKGRYYEAEVAQRHAVPTLADLVTASQASQIRDMYESAIDPGTGQSILTAFQRVISEVLRAYPILVGHTRYSIGSARIISLDLMEVTAGGGSGPAARKRTAMMFMLARQVMTRDFFIDPDEITAMVRRGYLPPAYETYHLERARQNLEVPKVICMDEFHRTGNLPAITDQVLQDAREGRKFNIDLKIASQLPEDFPPAIMEVASTLFVCNAGSENSIDYLTDMYKLTDNERAMIRHNLTGPGSQGSPIWAMFKIKGNGQVRQELLLTLGPAEIWAFSTTSEDVALRSRLYRDIGPQLARRILAARFPGGSAKEEIEKRVTAIEERGERLDDDGRVNVVGGLADELKEQALLLSIKAG